MALVLVNIWFQFIRACRGVRSGHVGNGSLGFFSWNFNALLVIEVNLMSCIISRRGNLFQTTVLYHLRIVLPVLLIYLQMLVRHLGTASRELSLGEAILSFNNLSLLQDVTLLVLTMMILWRHQSLGHVGWQGSLCSLSLSTGIVIGGGEHFIERSLLSHALVRLVILISGIYL